MDGTICLWNTGATAEKLCRPGYFLGLEGDKALLPVLRPLLSEDANARNMARGGFYYDTGLYLDNDAEIYILSAAIGIPQVREKNLWLDRNFPVPYRNRIYCACGENKAYAAAQHLGQDIDGSWCLLDDYSPNLCCWAESGGRAVKYINGINGSGKVWKGERLELSKR